MSDISIKAITESIVDEFVKTGVLSEADALNKRYTDSAAYWEAIENNKPIKTTESPAGKTSKLPGLTSEKRRKIIDAIMKCIVEVNKKYISAPQYFYDSHKKNPFAKQDPRMMNGLWFASCSHDDILNVQTTEDGRPYMLGKLYVYNKYTPADDAEDKYFSEYFNTDGAGKFIEEVNAHMDEYFHGIKIMFARNMNKLIFEKNLPVEEKSFEDKKEHRDLVLQFGLPLPRRDTPEYHKLVPVYFVATGISYKADERVVYEDTVEYTDGEDRRTIWISGDGTRIKVKLDNPIEGRRSNMFTFDIVEKKWGPRGGNFKNKERLIQSDSDDLYRIPLIGDRTLDIDHQDEFDKSFATKIATTIYKHCPDAKPAYILPQTYLLYRGKQKIGSVTNESEYIVYMGELDDIAKRRQSAISINEAYTDNSEDDAWKNTKRNATLFLSEACKSVASVFMDHPADDIIIDSTSGSILSEQTTLREHKTNCISAKMRIKDKTESSICTYMEFYPGLGGDTYSVAVKFDGRFLHRSEQGNVLECTAEIYPDENFILRNQRGISPTIWRKICTRLAINTDGKVQVFGENDDINVQLTQE